MSAQLFASLRDRFEQHAHQRLAQRTQALSDIPLIEPLLKAVDYAALNGGKRIRPLLTYLSAQCINHSNLGAHQNTIGVSHGAEDANATPNSQLLVDDAALAVELVHCYSLVHDDLPAMDDDHLRRGQPTCHIAFGEANAILAGDALQALAFDILSNHSHGLSERQLKMVQCLAHASGIAGMVGGQTIDLEAERRAINFAQLSTMHRMKTGALITAAVDLGALAVDATEAQRLALKNYSEAMGLAFQIRDDILDVTGNEADTGKTQGADIAQGKSTFISLLGLTAANEQAARLRDQAIAALAPFGAAGEPLIALADFIIARNQ